MPNASPEFGVLLSLNPSATGSLCPTESDETTIALDTWSTSTTAPQTASARQPGLARGEPPEAHPRIAPTTSSPTT